LKPLNLVSIIPLPNTARLHAPKERAPLPVWSEDGVVLVSIAALWLQLSVSAAPIWRFGEYYEYGWYVPPIAVFFFYRRWRDLSPTGRRVGGW
jgi:hypothetical protein